MLTITQPLTLCGCAFRAARLPALAMEQCVERQTIPWKGQHVVSAANHPPREVSLQEWQHSLPVLEELLPREWQTSGADREALDALLLLIGCKDAAEAFASAAILMQCALTPAWMCVLQLRHGKPACSCKHDPTHLIGSK